jgi:SAM-dependent methyltransferase
LIKKSTTYDSIHTEAMAAVDVNDQLTQAIVNYGLHYYKITPDELNHFISYSEYHENWDNQDRVHEALQHLWRDWAPEGLHERAAPVDFLTKQLLDLYPESERENRREGPVRILVPGSGLGRLAHDIAQALPDAEVTANELSNFMRLSYRFVEALTSPNAVEYFPFTDWWAYQPNREELLRKVRFPDKVVNGSAALLVEGDFTEVFNDKVAHYDAVVTFFFTDTAQNVMEYYDTIARILKPGGVWINMGPLLWHNAVVEFSLEDMVDLAEKGYGFEFLDLDEEWGPITLHGKKVRGREISYQCHEHSLRRHYYPVQYWAARLKENPERLLRNYEEDVEDEEYEKDEL